jgi:hypothetical protein
MRHFGQDILTVADELTEAYVEIFTAPPWDDQNARTFRERLETDARRPGFRAVLALSDSGGVDAFVTGWTTQSPFRTGLGRRLLSAVTTTGPEGRAWLLTWDQAHDTLAFYRRTGWTEPAPVPGQETDVVVFLAPAETARTP